MKLMASSDGVICRTVAWRRRRILPAGRPASTAATMAATKVAVLGTPAKFRFAVASSAVGCGAIGGIFKTALCRYGIGILSASKFRYFSIDGRPVTKIKSDATRKGDQPFSTSPAE